MEWVVWAVLLLTIGAIASVFVWSKLKRGPRTVERVQLPVIGPVPDFTLTNQIGRAVTLADLRGKVWVGDIVFTRCAGPCPQMTKQMAELQAALPATAPIAFVTLTTDPDFDTPEVLKKYGDKHNADPARWQFLTGDKSEIAKLAVDGLKLTAIEKSPEERTDPADLFIHSTIFVVVDKRGQLRGIFETQGVFVDWPNAREKIVSAVRQLEAER